MSQKTPIERREEHTDKLIETEDYGICIECGGEIMDNGIPGRCKDC